MIAAAPPAMAVACVTCLLLAGALVAVRSALAPARVAAARSGSTPSMFTGIGRNRMAVGAAAGVLVLLATRWFFLALLVGLMVVLWGRLLHDDRAQAERVRIEGIAKWLEDLRDTLRGSSVGAEEALEQVAMRAPDSIA